MDFDINSMKQRAKALMAGADVKPVGIIQGLIAFAYGILLLVVLSLFSENMGNVFAIMAVAELVYLNIRSSCAFFSLKVTREEPVVMSDIFAAFKEKPVQMLFCGIIKDILYVIGICLMFFGFFIPWYWFRFSAYIIKDEGCGPFAALFKSMKLLKGHYGELMKLDISTLGWHLGMVFSYGFIGFYAKPYLGILYAEYYDHLKAQNKMFG